MLDVPSRICLGLTSKFLASMSLTVSTDLTDQPTLVRFHTKCHIPPCVFTRHISDRRILLLELKTWMPQGLRLCWICLKFSKIGSSKWHSTRQIRFDGYSRIRLPALDQLRLPAIHCHDACMTSGRTLADWARRTPGASGGFSRFMGTNTPPQGGYLYDSGF